MSTSINSPSDNSSVQTDPAQVKPTWYWIKDTKGFGSVTVTLVFVSFWVTTAAYILSMFEKIGSLQIRPFDVAACGSYFLPILTLYFGRKFTDAKFNSDSTKGLSHVKSNRE